MNRPLEDLISIARSVRVEEEVSRRGIRLKGRIDRAGPCPHCGGRDRFSINLKKQVFNCRGCQRGGDVIELVQFLDDLDFRQAVALLALLHQLGPIFAIFGASDRDKSLDLKV
jgi:DNA primase